MNLYKPPIKIASHHQKGHEDTKPDAKAQHNAGSWPTLVAKGDQGAVWRWVSVGFSRDKIGAHSWIYCLMRWLYGQNERVQFAVGSRTEKVPLLLNCHWPTVAR